MKNPLMLLLNVLLFCSLSAMEEGNRSRKRKRQEPPTLVQDKKPHLDEEISDIWHLIPLEIQELIFDYAYSSRPRPSSLYSVIKGLKKLGQVNKAFTETADHMLKRVLNYVKLNHPAMALQLLIKASAGGDVQLVSLMIAHGYDLNKADISGMNALMAACEHKQFNITQLLINAGVAVNSINKDGITALMIACRLGTSIIVKELLTAGADVLKRDNQGKSAVHYAVKSGSKQIVKMLMEKGAEVLSTDCDEKCPLELAILMARADLVKVMLKHQKIELAKGLKFFLNQPADEQMLRVMNHLEEPDNLKDSEIIAMAYNAASSGQQEVFDLVLQSYTARQVKDLDLQIAERCLHVALLCGNVKLAESFVNVMDAKSHKLFLLDPNFWGFSLVMSACLHMQPSFIEKLIDLSKTPLSDDADFVKIIKAIIHANYEELSLLFSDRKNCSIKDYLGATPLMYAVLRGDPKMVDLLIKAGCSVMSMTHNEKLSVLSCAVYKNNEEIVRMLINAGADCKEETCLIAIATAKSSISLVKLLLEKGAEVNDMGTRDCAFSIACDMGNFELVKLLYDHEAHVEWSDLADAMRNGHSEICRFILERWPDLVEVADNDTEFTLLEEMLREGNEPMVKLLLEFGADRECINDPKQSLRTIAEKQNRPLLEYVDNFKK